MDINSPQIEKRITDLQSKVKKYDNSKPAKSSISSVLDKTIYIYVGVPVIIFIVLLVARPKFVRSEVQLESGEVELRNNYTKMLMWALVFGTIIDVTIYVIKRRKKKN